MISFKKWSEAADYKNFLQGSLNDFPDNSVLLIFADALEDDGDPLANFIRQLASGELQGDYEKIRLVLRAAREVLEKQGIDLETNVVNHNRKTYAWKGSTIVQRSRFGGQFEPIALDEVPEEIIKGLAILAAEMYASSQNKESGLKSDIRFRRQSAGESQRGLKKELSSRTNDKRESALRHAIGDFLTYFEVVEEMARRMSTQTRPRQRELGELERSLRSNGTGYLMQIPSTISILTNYVTRYGTNDFLVRLSQRIFETLRNIGQIDDLEPEEKFINDLNRLATLIK